MDTDPASRVISSAPSAQRSDVMAVFGVMWAAVTLFHVWGTSGRITDLASNWTTLGGLQAVAAVLAIVVLARPRRLPPLVAMAALGPVIAWFEAPILGSHWVVVSLVDLALVLAYVQARTPAALERSFVPVARWVLIGFYSFAAFAKLNHAFFTPEVSCGTYYLDELARSLHLSIDSQSGAAWTHLVPFGVAGVELAVPLLLLVRRTRNLGVVVALAFHGLIALDQVHPFADFSSVLNALFVLFLPAAFAPDVVALYRRQSEPALERLRAAAVLGPAIVLAIELYGRGSTLGRIFADSRGWAWVVYDAVVVGLVLWFLWTRRPAPAERPLSFRASRVPRWLVVVPVLVLLTGLSPYLELRTAYAFNMYSNLRTADGDSNHLLLTRTLPLTDYQSDLVRILATSDPSLQHYVDERFDLPFFQLRDYLSRHPDVSIRFVRHGVDRQLARAADDPALVEPVPSWQSKLFAFRSLDQTDPGRCQPAFLPAL